MAVVGSAEVVVRAITNKVRDDIARAFKDATPAVAQAGRDHGKTYADSFNKAIGTNLSKGIENSLFNADTTSSGTLGGARYSDAFNKSLGSNLDLEGAFDDIDLTDIGRNAGRSLGDGVRQETRRVGNDVEDDMTNAGNRGGSGFVRGFMSSGFQNAAMAAREAFSSFLAVSNIAGPALGGLVGGLSAVVSGLFAMAGAASNAIGVLAALPSAISVAAQAGGTLKLAFSGIGDALKAGLSPVSRNTAATTRAVNAGAKAVRAAEKGIADAARQAARQVADAKRALRDAYEAAARAAADAARRVTEAERDLGDAQNETRIAQLALNAARRAGTETLQQLGFAAEDAALSEQRAQFALEDAFNSLQAVQNLPPDNRTRQEAELAFKEAELNYRQAKDRAADLASENEAAAEAGVEGTKEVVDAKNDILSAQEKEQEAEEKLADARRDQGRVAADNAKRIAAAQLALSRAQADGARAVANAQAALKDAYTQQGTAAQGAAQQVDKFAEAMKNLSPQAQSFVRYLISIQDEIRGLKAAAGEELFPRLQTALEPIVNDLFPVLEDGLRQTGLELGEIAIKISGVITSSEGLEHIKNIMGNNNEVIKIGGDVLENLAKIMLRVMDAAGPLIKEFATWAKTLTDGWEASTKGEDGMKRLTDFFDKAARTARQLWRIITNVWDVLGDLKIISEDAGFSLLDSFEKATKALSNFTSDDANKQQLTDFFNNASESLKIIGGLIGDVAAGFLKMGGSKEVGEAFKTLGEAGPNITKIFDTMTAAAPKVATLFVKVTDIIAALTASDSAGSFLDGLIWAAEKLAGILNNDIVQSSLKMAAPFLGAALAMGRLWKIGGFFAKVLFGIPASIIKSIGTITRLGRAIGGLRPSAQAAQAARATGAQRADTTRGPASGSSGRRAQRAATTQGNTIGQAFSQGMARGIAVGTRAVTTAATALARAAVTATKTFLRSRSPSLVAAGIGEDFGEGFELGIKASQLEVNAAAKGMAAGAVASAKTGTAGAAAAGAGVGKVAAAPIAARGAAPAAQAGNMTKALGKAGGALKSFGRVAAVVGKGLGSAMSLAMGPIGMIAMIAIPLLIEGFKYLYNNSEGFRKFVDGIVAGLKMLWSWLVEVIPPALKAVGDFFVKIWGGIKTAFGVVVMAIKWYIDNILMVPIRLYIAYLRFLWSVVILVWDGIKAAIGLAIEGIKWYWDNVLKPVIDAIVAAFQWCVDQIKLIWSNFLLGLQIIWGAIKGLWDQYGQPAIDAVVEAFKTFVNNIKGFFTNVIKGWQLIFTKLADIWKKYGIPIVDAVKDFFKKRIDTMVANFLLIRDGFMKAINAIKAWWEKYGVGIINAIKTFVSNRVDDIAGLWNKIKTGFTDAVNAIKTWFKNTGEGILNTIKGKFEDFVENVGDVWDDISTGPKKAIGTLIDNLNKWLIAPLDAITSKFGLDIKKIQKPAGLAEGGPVTGTGGPMQDNQIRRLSVGEYVLRERAVRKLGTGTADYINRTGKLPRIAYRPPSQGAGGMFAPTAPKWFKGLEKWAKDGVGNMIGKAMDGFKKRLPSGEQYIPKFIRAIWDKWTTAAKNWGDTAQKKAKEAQEKHEAETSSGPGNFQTTGTMKSFGSGKAGSRKAGRYFTGGSGSTYAGHQPSMNKALDFMVSGGGAVKRGSAGFKAGSNLAQNFKANARTYNINYVIWYRRIWNIQRNSEGWRRYFDWNGGTPGREHTNHVHASYFAKGGVAKATSGGILSVLAEAGKSERVEPLDANGLSVRDKAMIQMMIEQAKGGSGGGPTSVQVFIGDKEITDIVDTRITKHDDQLAQALNTGSRRRYHLGWN